MLFWGLIILGVVVLARYLARADRAVGARLTPEQLLADRLARGEIDEEEYRQRLTTCPAR